LGWLFGASDPGIQALLALKLRLQLAALHSATQIEDMDFRAIACICSRGQARGDGRSGF
jgi:hypothetical protein